MSFRDGRFPPPGSLGGADDDDHWADRDPYCAGAATPGMFARCVTSICRAIPRIDPRRRDASTRPPWVAPLAPPDSPPARASPAKTISPPTTS